MGWEESFAEFRRLMEGPAPKRQRVEPRVEPRVGYQYAPVGLFASASPKPLVSDEAVALMTHPLTISIPAADLGDYLGNWGEAITRHLESMLRYGGDEQYQFLLPEHKLVVVQRALSDFSLYKYLPWRVREQHLALAQRAAKDVDLLAYVPYSLLQQHESLQKEWIAALMTHVGYDEAKYNALKTVLKNAANFEDIEKAVYVPTTMFTMHLFRLQLEADPTFYKTMMTIGGYFRFDKIDLLHVKRFLTLRYCERFGQINWLKMNEQMRTPEMAVWDTTLDYVQLPAAIKSDEKWGPALGLRAARRGHYDLIPIDIKCGTLYGLLTAMEGMLQLKDRATWASFYCEKIPEVVRAQKDQQHLGKALARAAVASDVMAYDHVPPFHRTSCARFILASSDYDHPRAGYLLDMYPRDFRDVDDEKNHNLYVMHYVLYLTRKAQHTLNQWLADKESRDLSIYKLIFQQHVDKLLPPLSGFACLFLFDSEQNDRLSRWYKRLVEHVVRPVLTPIHSHILPLPKLGACIQVFEVNLRPLTHSSSAVTLSQKREIFLDHIMRFTTLDYVQTNGPDRYFRYASTDLVRNYYEPYLQRH